MNSADVFLKDVAVGRLERYEDLQHTFTFEPTWLADPDRPVLGQIFEDRRPRPLTTSGLPCWFAHLLPQGGPLRRFLERACGLEAWDDLGLLLAAGEDLPGAVRVVPAAAGQGPRVPEASVARVPEATDSFGPSFSLAGAQWKLSVRRGERGLVVPVRGELGDWIAKFHDPEHPVLPRVEFATTAWAGRSGIEIPETRLATLEEFHDLPEGVPSGDGMVFMTRRFDRRHGDRVHMEDFGQILDRPPGPHQYRGSYEEMARVLFALAPADARRFVEQLVFCVLSGNGDGHLKNWSLLYPDGRAARLSPAYDLVSTILYLEHESLALSLAGEKAFEAIEPSSFAGIAEALEQAFEEVLEWVKEFAARCRVAWRAGGSEFGLQPEQRARLEQHLAAVRL